MNTFFWQAGAVLIIFAALAYWFVFHPYQVRTSCLQQATTENASVADEKDRSVRIDIANHACLLRSGLY